ncbi:hypothetical protein ECC02_009584 [Trypanosoma cruzi]|uniref:Mucin TcMUCII n=1 Tax=Trypanosoma cruzi TaxID=5693 RepID=A0A7J6XUK5_TRYCR|nr:hypothetical protein ECC02_009584 [Trypanosoma cruzi]
MPGCCPLLMWCALCVCLPHLSSPLLLSMSLTVQISSTPLNDTLTMMTCRLLCALLVLALCCCPSVCVTDTVGNTNTETNITPKENVNKRTVTAVSSSTPTKPGPTAPADTTEEVSEEEPGSLRSSDSVIAGQVESNADMEIKPNTTTTTTTTTTKAPTTNTTTNKTTTTTTAPEAPSTTTTEVPTTTTTRAPSRLREIDGSLSSSAWVCAPLLLAVSALACTAVG